jgi:hypothetical protein
MFEFKFQKWFDQILGSIEFPMNFRIFDRVHCSYGPKLASPSHHGLAAHRLEQGRAPPWRSAVVSAKFGEPEAWGQWGRQRGEPVCGWRGGRGSPLRPLHGGGTIVKVDTGGGTGPVDVGADGEVEGDAM